MSDHTDLIGTVVEAEIAGRRIEAVVCNAEQVLEGLQWRSRLTLACDGRELVVAPTTIV